jgi:protein ImuB
MRRVAALVLPLLACEVVRQRASSAVIGPLAVIVEPEANAEIEGGARPVGHETGPRSRPVDASATLDLVDDEARRYGVRPGMKVTEACALVAGLSVHRVTLAEVEAALGRVAELASSLAPITSIRLESKALAGGGMTADPLARCFDTIWLDVTGAAHLVGGEEALSDELVQRAASLGHRGCAAIADGPRIAEAIARFAPGHAAQRIVPAGDSARALAELPVAALPVDSAMVGWFLRLGLVTVGDLVRLPRAALAARLPHAAPLVLELIAGRDPAPLVPFEPPRILIESASFDDGVEHTEALLFVLRGMASRLSARLAARGEACSRLEVELVLDRSIAALRAVSVEPPKPRGAAKLSLVVDAAARPPVEPANRAVGEARRDGPMLHLAVDLPAHLVAEADLVRALRVRLERVDLAAPVVSMRVVIPAIARARRVQLDLSRGSAADPDALPTLLAELSAEIGVERLGVLAALDAHAPERQSGLVAPDLSRDRPYTAPPPHHPFGRVTRLLPDPVPLGEFGLSRVVAVDQALMAVDARRFVLRLDEVGWWTAAPLSRDYLTAMFAAPPLAGEALVYVDRQRGLGFLQGWLE